MQISGKALKMKIQEAKNMKRRSKCEWTNVFAPYTLLSEKWERMNESTNKPECKQNETQKNNKNSKNKMWEKLTKKWNEIDVFVCFLALTLNWRVLGIYGDLTKYELSSDIFD